MTSLRKGTRLYSDAGQQYAINRQLGEGGFGQTYEASRLTRGGNHRDTVCVKICRSRKDWHGEAFFGELLRGRSRVVELLDAFVHATGSGRKQKRLHVLVFEYMRDGTVWEALDDGKGPWPEQRVRREIGAILRVLADMHNAGVTHRDLKPDNVYLRQGRLVLGDFGIAKMTFDPKTSFASSFAPGFAPGEVLKSLKWGQIDDIYQVGLLAGTLLSGEVWWGDTPSAAAVSSLEASDAFKSWIWHATGARSRRYLDALDALEALDALDGIRMTPTRPPASLAGRNIVFTGRLAQMPRAEASDAARRLGATVQTTVGESTDTVVVGRIKAGSAGAKEGLKLFAVRERKRLGQEIRVLSDRQFKRLVSPD